MTRKLLDKIISLLLTSYLNFVYFTTRWEYVLPNYYSLSDFHKAKRTIFAFWHNRLAIAPFAFKEHKNQSTYALVSPHKDGKIISNILYLLGYKVIEGSTNRNPFTAVKSIIAILNDNGNIVITPDGPRGPKYKINSNIIAIAKRSNADIIPLSFNITNNFILSSWDSFIFPLPFGKGKIIIGDKIELSENEELTMQNLEETLINLSEQK